MKRAYRSKTEVLNAAWSVFTEEDRWERRKQDGITPPHPTPTQKNITTQKKRKKAGPVVGP